MRGVVLSYETVREWCLKFGQTYANHLRRRSPRPSDRWHLDEVFLKINGGIHYLWRAVDQNGNVLDIPYSAHERSGEFLDLPAYEVGRVPFADVAPKGIA